MKHFSLKAKLTFLYTLVMTSMVCIIFAFLFSFSNKKILLGVGSQLEDRVEDAIEDISVHNGSLAVDSDFLELEDGIFLSLYSSSGEFLYGKVPYTFDNSIPFSHGIVRKTQNQDTQYYVLDSIFELPEYGIVDVRGILSISAAEKSFIQTIRLTLILFPLMVFFTAILGYFMIKRTLRPVDQIIQTVQSIRADGNLSHRISIGQGTDEIHRLASTFNSMLVELESILSRERQFTSDVAHELRTPLTTMTLLCDELLKQNANAPETKEDLQLLQKKIHGLNHMISQLLMLSRADQGRAHIEYDSLNLSDIAQIACEEALELAKTKNICIHTDIQPDLSISGDETLLIRCFMNLLQNAITYGNENGNIWFTLTSSNASHCVEGMIKDDGIGISEQDLPQIWNRFYRADRSRTDMEHSGLGLSMVDWIIQTHHGTIHATSTLGEGTSFYFTFPLSK